MQKRGQLRRPRPAPWLRAWRYPATVERRGVRRGGVPGVVARPSVGCAGHGGGAERRGAEGAL